MEPGYRGWVGGGVHPAGDAGAGNVGDMGGSGASDVHVGVSGG